LLKKLLASAAPETLKVSFLASPETLSFIPRLRRTVHVSGEVVVFSNLTLFTA
jgi:hypothetical protein